jgi:hypothetical protein
MRNVQQHLAPGNSTSWADLSHTIRVRLEREGIVTLADWRQLGRRRRQIFGITREHVRQIDAIARGAR